MADMKKVIITIILALFVPLWLVLLFIAGQGVTSFAIESFNGKNFSLTDLKLPKAYLVQSGSMEPAIKTGSVTIIKPASEYKIGDIITS